MPTSDAMTTRLLDALTDEITTRDGAVTHVFHEGGRLFARSVIPGCREVRPGDRIQRGVAMRATDQEAWIHPYIFRIVCRNGLVVARTLQTRHVTDLEIRDPAESLPAVRETVGACCEEEAFEDIARRIGRSAMADADRALALIPMIERFAGRATSSLVRQVLNEFFEQSDETRYGVANAVTATAREVRNPEVRWKLEEFGGGIAVGAGPIIPCTRPPAARARRARQMAAR